MYTASWAARSATGWLRSILQSPCHHLWDIYGFTTEFQTTQSCCYFHLGHQFTDADVTNSWPTASLNSQISTKLFHVPFGYLNAAYCSVILPFHKLAWCTVSNVIFWMLCWKRLFKGAHHKINAVLYRRCKLPLQISVADIFSVSDFGVLKAYVFAKDPSQEKPGWKDLNYHTSETGISSCFLSLHQYKQIHRKLVLCMRKLGIQTLRKCVFFMFIHM